MITTTKIEKFGNHNFKYTFESKGKEYFCITYNNRIVEENYSQQKTNYMERMFLLMDLEEKYLEK